MDNKKILIFSAIIVFIAILIWPREGKLKIASVEDGNTVILSNGATVKLLGVASTLEAKGELEDLGNAEVLLQHDSNAMFDVRELRKGSTVYAYMLLPNNYECVNATILKKGFSPLVENCNDSLRAFRRYAEAGKRGGTQPTPTPKKVIEYSEDGFELGPYVPDSNRKHSAWYNDGNMNLDMLEEACDYDVPYTKNFANQLAAKSPGNFNPGQICEIFKYCYNNWRYVNDPADKEYVARASESIYSSLTGDCDDFAVLMASCILSVGGRACINTGWGPYGGHAFTEVDIAQFPESLVVEAVRENFPEYSISSLNYRNDGPHKWLNLDWQAAHPGGKYFDCSVRRESYPYENGRWTWKHLNG